MYEQLTKLRIPGEQEARSLASSSSSGGGGASSSSSGGKPAPPSSGRPAGPIDPNLRKFLPAHLVQAVGDGPSPRMPSNAKAIPLKAETEALLRGPQVVIYKGDNSCIMRERQAIHDLLSEHDAQGIRGYLVESHRLYSPSTINKHFRSLDVPGKGQGECWVLVEALLPLPLPNDPSTLPPCC